MWGWGLTAPVGIKVSVEVGSDAGAHPAAPAAQLDRAVLPPHPVLKQKAWLQLKLLPLQLLKHLIYHRCFTWSYCCPCVFVSIRVHNRQDVDVHVVQYVGNVGVKLVKCQRLGEKEFFSEKKQELLHDTSHGRQSNWYSHIVWTISRTQEKSTLWRGCHSQSTWPSYSVCYLETAEEERFTWGLVWKQSHSSLSYFTACWLSVPLEQIVVAFHMRSQWERFWLYWGCPVWSCLSKDRSVIEAACLYVNAMLWGKDLNVRFVAAYVLQVVIFLIESCTASWVCWVIFRLHLNQLVGVGQ